jgi:hypothetical protein
MLMRRRAAVKMEDRGWRRAAGDNLGIKQQLVRAIGSFHLL